MKKQYKLTQDGIDELVKEKDQLISKRAEITESIKIARELGDLSENAEYASAKSDQERTETRISEIEHILKNVEIIKAPKNNNMVKLGSTVKLKGDNGKIKQFQVVGTVEADPLAGKVSDESPIGMALLEKRVGDKVEIGSSNEVQIFKIVELA